MGCSGVKLGRLKPDVGLFRELLFFLGALFTY